MLNNGKYIPPYGQAVPTLFLLQVIQICACIQSCTKPALKKSYVNQKLNWCLGPSVFVGDTLYINHYRVWA